MERILPALALLLAAAAPPPVTISGAWARATPPGATTAALYFTLSAATPDRLTGLQTTAAANATLHQETSTGGIMRMRPVTGGLALPAGHPISLAPGGYHVMLEGLKAPLTAGQTLTLRLSFAHAAAETISVPVRPIGATGPDDMAGMDMGAPK